MTAGPSNSRANLRLALIAGSVAAGMVGLAFASVPLYRVFCQVTGFGGTTQRADAAPVQVLDRKMTVAFDANVNTGLNWQFKPAQASQKVRIGEQTLAFYKAVNNSSKPITGTATFNVTPVAAGAYFSKVECFCFTEQTLEPGQAVDMPVSYFIDPDIVNDPDVQSIDTITLSYTFYRSMEQQVRTSSGPAAAPEGNNKVN
jgi:cytochrome c oxidase assembly protein subunit 11